MSAKKNYAGSMLHKFEKRMERLLNTIDKREQQGKLTEESNDNHLKTVRKDGTRVWAF